MRPIKCNECGREIGTLNDNGSVSIQGVIAIMDDERLDEFYCMDCYMYLSAPNLYITKEKIKEK